MPDEMHGRLLFDISALFMISTKYKIPPNVEYA